MASVVSQFGGGSCIAYGLYILGRSIHQGEGCIALLTPATQMGAVVLRCLVVASQPEVPVSLSGVISCVASVCCLSVASGGGLHCMTSSGYFSGECSGIGLPGCYQTDV